MGAGSGIGEAAALGLAAFGAHVVCADLNEAAAGKVAEEIKAGGGALHDAIKDAGKSFAKEDKK